MGRAVPLDDLPDNIVPADDLPPPAKQPRVIRSLGEKLPNEREGVDFVFDKPAGKTTPRSSLLRDVNDVGTGIIDAAASAARNVPFDIAASAGKLLGLPKLTGFANDQRGGPVTEAGRDISNKAGEFVGEAVTPWMELGGRALDATGIPNLKGDVGRLLGTANDVLNVAGGGSALLGGVRSRVANTAAREGLAASEQVRNAGSVAPVAKAAGFDVTPSTVAGTRSVKPSGYAGMMEGDARNPEASLRNAQNMNQRLGEELSIPVGADGRLEPGAFDTARLPAFGVYDEAKRFPGANNPEYGDAVLRAIQRVDVPTDAAPEVARLVQRYHSVGDSAQLVEDLKNLRRTASKRREGDTANQVANEALADVQMAIADSLEDELGRRAAAAGDHGFQERLQDARQHLAQLYETERATSGGYVNVKDLAARQQKTGKLTGNLQLGAHMGENMPDVFMHPQDAAPASMGRTPEAWGAKSFLFRTAERLGGGALSRRAMRGYNEGIPVGPNALDEFNIDPVASRGRPSPMGPNSGPQAPPQPEPPFTPWAGPLELQADAPPGYFSNVLGPQQGRNLAPGSEFSLEGQPYGAGPLQAFEGDLLPWEVPTDVPPLQGPRSDFASQLGPVQPRLDEALGSPPGMPPRPRGVTGPRSAQLTDPTLPHGFQFLDDSGPMPPQGPTFGPADEFPGPVTPEGQPPAPAAPAAATPEAAPSIASDLVGDGAAVQAVESELDRVFKDMTALYSRGVPRSDPAIQALEQEASRLRTQSYDLGKAARTTTPGVSDLIGPAEPPPEMLTLQRNVPEGTDPFTPRNRAGSLAMFRQGTPEAAEGSLYGPNQGVRELPASDFTDVGSIDGLRELAQGNPDMTISDLLVLISQRADRPRGVTFARPAELDNPTPREYHWFPPAAPPSAMPGNILGHSWEEIQALQQRGNIGRKVDTARPGDYGADPVGDGTFRMVPSGDIVDFAERSRRLGK